MFVSPSASFIEPTTACKCRIPISFLGLPIGAIACTLTVAICGSGEPIRSHQRGKKDNARCGAFLGFFGFFSVSFLHNSMDIGFSTQLLVFLFYFHTITRLHELDGLLILMGMNNRSISWRIRSKFCSLLFLGCWLAGYPYLLFLLMGYWRKHKMRWEERNDKGKRMGRPWITFYSLDVETI